MRRTLIVRLEHDSDVDMPDSGCKGWQLVSFGRRHSSYEDPDRYVKACSWENGIVPAGIGLRRKLEAGLAFWLSYYEHGLGAWSLVGEGMQCRWDTAYLAGILLWTGKPGDIGAKTLQDRARDARGFLENYNGWMNGNTYWYSVETTEGDDVETIGGFIGEDAVNEALAGVLEAGDLVQVEGAAAWVFEAPEGVEVVDEHEQVSRLLDSEARLREAAPAMRDALLCVAQTLADFKPDSLRQLGLDHALAQVEKTLAIVEGSGAETAAPAEDEQD